MKDILFTTVCNDDYALGGQVMLYSMKQNIKNLDRCDFKIYYNDEFASLSEENKDKFRQIFPDVILEHVDKECYFNSKLPPAGNRAQGFKAAYLSLESFREFDYETVIMFDVDMLCIGDVSDLFDREIFFGIYNSNTGFLILNRDCRNEVIYDHLTSKINLHTGEGADQGIINKYIVPMNCDRLPAIYNQYPLSDINDDTRILHWAHYDYIKPWVIDEWAKRVDLFQDAPPYPNGGKDVGNIPVKSDKKAFDLWKEYKNRMESE